METVVNATLTIKSPAFSNNGYIPSKYTCDGINVNPPLTIDNLPKQTVSITLIVEDPDSPMGVFEHWILWNIPPTNKINESSAPGVQGRNSAKQNKYTGPCPPSGTHRYNFRVFALDIMLDLPVSIDKHSIFKAMEGHILAYGEITGLYKR
jgi:Raf kinase inhibitor-like YbhB/YbcL family protein